MNRIFLLAFGLLVFGCDNAQKNSETSENAAGVENTSSEDNSNQSVQEGAGSEISPQLEGIEDSATRLKVDTISSSQDAQRAR
ncbi:hypothetical protein I5M27_05405 [Adhaeribacter sp. BT258]|uniref:Uncharacterized protein n=1 Tax=Adhaeribacter terrigena TaxID=2793070 RepID=A0ABS1BZR3_9BACT|nr:hypothetical protein [Adhaeribacter terrigena]MBK0402411.1 hypothetical protein [Adhaeribacter terrigena]